MTLEFERRKIYADAIDELADFIHRAAGAAREGDPATHMAWNSAIQHRIVNYLSTLSKMGFNTPLMEDPGLVLEDGSGLSPAATAAMDAIAAEVDALDERLTKKIIPLILQKLKDELS